MKKMIICAVLHIMAIHAFSQQTTPSTPLTREDYLQKSKNQKAAGWVLLGGGALIDIIGIATFPKDYVYIDLWGEGNSSSTESKANTSGVLLLVGSSAMLASIPFFISSHVNRKRAIKLTVDTQQLRTIKNSSMYTTNYPALTMKISL